MRFHQGVATLIAAAAVAACGGVAQLPLAAGDYAFICFVPDAKDGKLHVEHGMAKQFRID